MSVIITHDLIPKVDISVKELIEDICTGLFSSKMEL